MYQGEETIVMDVKPLGFTGGDKWWDYVLSGDEKERLDSMMGAALLDKSISERLLNGIDITILTTFGLSEPTISLIRNVNATTLPDFAQQVIHVLQPEDPPTDNAASGPPDVNTEKGPKGVNKLILVVDADNAIQDELAPRLHAQGHAVMGISTGERALPLAKAVLPDLIIADLQAEGLTGVELVSRIRTIPEAENTPVIIYTNSRDESVLRQIRRMSGAFIVAKSAPMEQLLTRVNAALGTVRVEIAET